jgi:hypothetical protein
MSETQHIGAADYSGLPAAQRAARYRELAEMHLSLGGAAMAEEARAAHLELAALWTRLASQADHHAQSTGFVEAASSSETANSML